MSQAMSQLIRCYPGDSGLEYLLVVTLGVALLSSAAWIGALRLAGTAALKHLVLFAGLICCLAMPGVAWLCGAAGFTLVSIPIFCDRQIAIASGATPSMELDLDALGCAAGRRTFATPRVNPQRDVARPSWPDTDPPLAQPREVPSSAQTKLAPTVAAPQAASAAAHSLTFREFAAAAMLLWAIGAGLMFVRLLYSCARVVQLRRTSPVAEDERLLRIFRQVTDQLRVRRVPLVLVSNRTITPLAVGLGRPAVILPQRLLRSVNDQELRDVLLHEVAHLARGDQRIVLVQQLAAALYWPIVSVHALNRQLTRAREEVCDNVVLAGRDPLGYGKTLLHVAELLVHARATGAAVGIFGSRGTLEQRIAGLIDPRRNKMTTTGRKAACLVMLLFIAGGLMASATRLAASAPAAPLAADRAPAAGPKETPPKEPPQTIVLRGKVLGPDDRPVAGAHLFFNLDEWHDSVELGTTAADGTYRFAVPEKQLRRIYSPGFSQAKHQAALLVTADGLGAGWRELRSVKGHRMGEMQPEYAYDFRLKPDFPIEGQVVDPSGKPVAGAAIGVGAIYELSDPRWYKMHPAIKARDPNYMTHKQVDVNHWFTPLYHTAWTAITPAVTDAEGRFKLTGVGADRAVRLEINGPGIKSPDISVLTRDDVTEYTEAVRKKFPKTQGSAGVRLFDAAPTIQVEPARTISGVVRDATTRDPIAGARISVVNNGGQATTDKHGRYRIQRGDDGHFDWVYANFDDNVRHSHAARPFTDSQDAGEIVVDFEMPHDVVIQGRVLETGTDRPIVSAPSSGCHIPWPGPLRTGNAYYFPLATNTAIRGTPSGNYFARAPKGSVYWLTTPIEPDGSFRMAVPPGPGVLVVESSPGVPPEISMMGGLGSKFKTSDGIQRLFPYTKLKGRAKDDGAPPGDAETLAGFTGPIKLTQYHAYQVIDPAADAKTLDVTLNVPRAPSRMLRFIGPDGHAVAGLKVNGLVAPPWHLLFVVDGAEAEVVGLEADKPREVYAMTSDGKYVARTMVGVDDPQPRTIQLEPSGAISARLVDDATGQPLAGFQVGLGYKRGNNWEYVLSPEMVTTDAEGRFVAHGVFPSLPVSLWLQGVQPEDKFKPRPTYRLESLANISVPSSEVRELGDIRIKQEKPAK